MSSTADNAKDESLDGSSATHDRAESTEGGDAPEDGPSDDGAQHLVKLSYHDSGIDIRDPVLHVNTANTKKVGFNWERAGLIFKSPLLAFDTVNG